MNVSHLKAYLNAVKKKHPGAECVNIKVNIEIPYQIVAGWDYNWVRKGKMRVGSYVRIFFNKDFVSWFMMDVSAVDIISSKFKNGESTLNDFIKEIQSLLVVGGDFKWIPINKISNRYKTLWGGGQIQYGDQELGERDGKLQYPEDEDAKF